MVTKNDVFTMLDKAEVCIEESDFKEAISIAEKAKSMANDIGIDVDGNIKSIYEKSFPALEKEVGFYAFRGMEGEADKTRKYMKRLANDVGMEIPEYCGNTDEFSQNGYAGEDGVDFSLGIKDTGSGHLYLFRVFSEE